MKKTILFLFNREVTYLPPFMAILDSLCDEYSLKVISYEKTEGREHLEQQYAGKDVSFLGREVQSGDKSVTARAKRRISRALHISTAFHKEAVRLMDATPHDLLWVIHEETAFEFRKALAGKKYLLSFYELNDNRREFLEQLKPVAQNALEVMVPEYNRACILRVWMKLAKTPTVIPNKPLNHPRKRNIPNSYQEVLEGKKIVLYQGYINRNRNLDKVCEAMKDMPGYCLVLMGKGSASYINELKQKYPQIIHISFIAPPEHLYVTSWAHIAIVKYDFVVLNAIFCAPNKTWEYTGFGIPVLCHDIPGLQYTIGVNKAGICTDLEDTECIKAAITEMESKYEEYSQNAVKYYESFDVRKTLNKIVDDNIDKVYASK